MGELMVLGYMICMDVVGEYPFVSPREQSLFSASATHVRKGLRQAPRVCSCEEACEPLGHSLPSSHQLALHQLQVEIGP